MSAAPPSPSGTGLRRLGGGLLAICAVAVVTIGPFVVHAQDALAGGGFAPGAQRAFWLPWQLYANVVSGRGIDDASGFPTAAPAGLFELVGNPGAAALLAPLHGLGDPVLAHNLGLAVLLVLNIVSAYLFGAALLPRPRPVLAAALVGGAGVWAWQMGAGALAGWVAPGLAALAAWLRASEGGRKAWIGVAIAWLAGVVAAPIVTGMVLIGGVQVVDTPRTARVDVAWILGIVALVVGVALPSALGGAPDLPPTALAWVGSREAVGLPIAVGAGMWFAWRAGGAARGAAALAAVAFLFAIGPFARDTTGELVRVAGFTVPLTPDIGAARSGHALLSGVAGIGIVALLAALSRRDLWVPARLAIGLGALIEPRLQVLLGQPVALWTGETWEIPDAVRGLGARPYTARILELPLMGVVDGMVGLVPLHRQAISGGPGETTGGPAREGLERQLVMSPRFATLLRLDEGSDVEIGPVVDDAGYDWILVAGAEPGLRVAVQRAVGRPIVETDRYALWKVHPDGGGAPDVARGAPPGASERPAGWAAPGAPGAGPGGLAPAPGGAPPLPPGAPPPAGAPPGGAPPTTPGAPPATGGPSAVPPVPGSPP